jgi:flagella basal body P-ring formation protein FlgA
VQRLAKAAWWRESGKEWRKARKLSRGEKVKEKDVKIRGVYEKLPGSGVW